MRGIDINDFYMGINFNQKLNIDMLIKILESERDETNPYFFN